MTIVAAFSAGVDAVVVADSRLSVYDDPNRPLVIRDICQKLFAPNGWSMVGWSGDLCMGRHLVRGIFNRLKHTPYDAADWLRDDKQVLKYVEEGFRTHNRLKADHKSCHKKPVELMIVRMDYQQLNVAKNYSLSRAPGVEIIIIQTPGRRVNRTRIGLEVIGSGAAIVDKTKQQEVAQEVAGFFRGTNPEHELAQRGFFAATVVNDFLSRNGGIPTVGPVSQILTLSLKGVRILSYFSWVTVEPGYGTYIAMRIEDGYWVQEHRPTGTKVRVVSPLEIHLKGPKWKYGAHELFDPARLLTRHSPGVLPEPDMVTAFLLYPENPAEIPAEIRAYWGDAPLAPMTFPEKPLKGRGANWLF